MIGRRKRESTIEVEAREGFTERFHALLVNVMDYETKLHITREGWVVEDSDGEFYREILENREPDLIVRDHRGTVEYFIIGERLIKRREEPGVGLVISEYRKRAK